MGKNFTAKKRSIEELEITATKIREDIIKSLEKAGFDYKNFNELGVCTLHYHVADLKKIKNMRDWIPEWCFKFIEWALRKNQGKCSFKLDWFAAKNLQVVPNSPKVIREIKYQGKEVSDHDPIVVDFKCMSS